MEPVEEEAKEMMLLCSLISVLANVNECMVNHVTQLSQIAKRLNTSYFKYQRVHDPIKQIYDGEITIQRFIKTYRLNPNTFINILRLLMPYLSKIGRAHV